MRDEPRAILARHFFDALFDCGFLTEEGRESLERALLGLSAVAFGLGLGLVRIFLMKYPNLRKAPAGTYLSELAADHAFLIALSMWVVALAVAAVAHALFPDETDLRVLMPAPISRATIFCAKLAALTRFVGLFVLGAQFALAPMFLLTMVGPPGTGTFWGWLAAYAVASTAGSLFAGLAVIAANGLLLLVTPLARVAAAVRSTIVFVLILSFLFIFQLPSAGRSFAAGVWWVRLVPPMWFVGLERWLVGEPGCAPLAVIGAASFGLMAGVSAASYALLYWRFPHIMARPEGAATRSGGGTRLSRNTPSSVRQAVTGFASMTLRRSPLHQGIAVTYLAAGAGLVASRFIVAGLPAPGRDPWLAIWSPLALIFFAAPAVRLALSVPIDLNANWVFRMTEAVDSRASVIDASVQTIFLLGVLVPVAVMLPLQWMALGSRTLSMAGVELAVGWLFVEVLMHDWRRLPFTSSYVPGKSFVPHLFVKAVAAFVLFTSVGGRILAACARIHGGLPAVFLLVAGLARWLFLLRRRRAPTMPLAFEDHVPSEINPLRLNAD